MSVSWVLFSEVLRSHAAARPDAHACLFLDDTGRESDACTFGELDLRARALAVALGEVCRVGDRALLLFPPGLDFVAAFWGCLYAGVVAVPAYPPRPGRADPRLQAIRSDAEPTAVLTVERLAARVEKALGEIPCLRTDEVAPERANGWSGPRTGRHDLAFLQYTSGSTSTPKGVAVRHGNLLHNEAAIQRGFGTDRDSVVVGWLPAYHDMGLIGNILHPIYLGARSVLMSPMAFLQRPRLWLEAIHRYRATVSGGPNFAYDLCVERVPEAEREGLDLSSWQVAFNGAEPVRAATLDRFSAAFAPQGFRRESFYPCYGLAEATLFVTGGDPQSQFARARLDAAALGTGRVRTDEAGAETRAVELVACGVSSELEVVIVDPGTGLPCPPDRVGEIWIRGESVADGYWRRPEESAEAFDAELDGELAGEGPFLRTGDLGFLLAGELYITGRHKDLVILRGRNLYPQDLELTAGKSHPALRLSGGAAFGVEVDGEERLVVAHELERRREGEAAAAADALRRAVADEHQVTVYEVVLLRAGTLPKTSSGKVRRGACRELYLGASGPDPRLFRVIARDRVAESTAPSTPGSGLDPRLTEGDLRATVAGLVARNLGQAEIDPRRPLTSLGLDSLGAVELAGALGERFGPAAAIPMARLLGGLTLDELILWVEENEDPSAVLDPPERKTEEPEPDEPTLSWEQRSLWLLETLAEGSGVNHLAVAARVEPALDPATLQNALEEVVRRHDALRIGVRVEDGEPRSQLLEDAVDFAAVSLTTETSDSDTDNLHQAAEEAFRPFDLARGPLVRVRLWQRTEGGQLLLFVAHHMAVDFASFEILLRELEVLYRLGPEARGESLVAPGATYAAYVGQQAARLATGGSRLLEGWRELLGEDPPVLDLPTDRPRPALATWRARSRGLTLGPAVAESLGALAAERGMTRFHVLMTAFQVLLHRYSGQPRVWVGTATNGRGHGPFRRVVGDFVNPVVIPGELGDDPTLAEALLRTRAVAARALELRDLPFAQLAERLVPARDPSRAPLFQALFLWQQARSTEPGALAALALGEGGAELRWCGRNLRSVALGERRVQTDVELAMAEAPGGGLVGSLAGNLDLFDAVSLERMTAAFETLCGDLAADPECPISHLRLLGPSARAQLTAWNQTHNSWPAEGVEEQILGVMGRNPERIAVFQGEEEITYGALARRVARRVAGLRALGLPPEANVAVCLERGPAMVEMVLAAFFAGAAWVPLDPSHPRQRLQGILEDSGARLLIGSSEQLERLMNPELRGMTPEELDTEAGEGDVPALELPGSDLSQLAYVIYTSGSTGRPKGVEVTRGGVKNFLRSMADLLAIGPRDVISAVTTLSFDISVLELLLPLTVGAGIDLVPREVAVDGRALAARLDAAGTTVLQATPATWRLLVDSGWRGRSELLALCGGETLDRELAGELMGRVGRLVNLYGPTECTVWSSIARVSARLDPEATVPIGGPIANTDLWVLDRFLRPVPPGGIGELHIGGDGVARGYWRRPALTAERFVPVPGVLASEVPGARLYRTGDLARHRTDGALEFLGRTDHQVKVRGYRIETGEIEAALAALGWVRQAVVVADARPAETRLVAWVVLAGGSSAAPEGWREELDRYLPGYMVPAELRVLEVFPLGPSGKVDRRDLVGRSASGRLATTRGPRRLPRNPREELLVALWEELLEVDGVGTGDDFFALGGHSLVATRLVARLRDLFGVELPLAEIFAHPTPASLARRLARVGGEPAAEPLAGPRPGTTGSGRLSFAQERLWFLERLHPGSATYHLPARGRIRGPLSGAALTAAWDGLVRRHGALRTTLQPVGEGAEAVLEAVGSTMLRVDLDGLPEPRRAEEERRITREVARRPFRLAGGFLARLVWLRLGAREHGLCVCLHHLVADGASLEILLGELEGLYTAALDGGPVIPAPAVSAFGFAAWQHDLWAEGRLTGQLEAWRRALDGAPQILDLPADHPRPVRRGSRGGRVSRSLPLAVAETMLALARRRGATPFMVLLTACQAWLYRLTGKQDLLVGTPLANRRPKALEKVVGLLTNLLPIRGRMAGGLTFEEALAATRAEVLAAHDRQEVPFERLVEQLVNDRDPGRQPLVQVAFVMRRAWPTIRLGEAEMVMEELPTATAKFDLTVEAEHGPEGLAFHLEYAQDLFEEGTAQRFLGCFVELLAGAVASSITPLGDLPLLGHAERQHLLHAARGGEAPAWPVGGVLRRVAAALEKAPDAPAVVDGDRVLSAGELWRRSGSLAAQLRDAGVGSTRPGTETIVALDLERSSELVLAALAVLRAGGAYLPLDPELPAERLAWVLRDSRARVLLRTEERSNGSEDAPAGVNVLAVSTASAEAETAGPPLPELSSPHRLAYVIYTSGSTGKPKGVGVSHGALANLVAWHLHTHGTGPADRTTLVASPGFDASVWELWPSLASGAALHVASAEVRTLPVRLARWLETSRVTETFLPTTLASALLDGSLPLPAPYPALYLAGLRRVLTGGDRLPRAPRPGLPFRLVNHYGPTECAVVSTAGEVPAGSAGVPPIGRPIDGFATYVTDRRLRLAPIGVNGELVIGGAGVARGYLGRPGMTAEAFVPDPFSRRPGGRLYRSGDLVRGRVDGSLDFIGRRDHQVKVRGLRIELGEVEAALERLPGVAEAVAVVRPGADDEVVLAAFVAGAWPSDGGREMSGLRLALRRELPPHMIPSVLESLETLPLTPRGKVDRRALASRPLPVAEEAGRAPSTPTEEGLVALWAELLGRKTVGVGDDFFAAGGHSLLAASLVARVRESFAVEIELPVIFEAPTPEALARVIDRTRSAEAPPVPAPRPEGEAAPLSFAQERLWFLQRLDPHGAAYHIAGGVRLLGTLEPGTLGRAVAGVLKRHEVLRSAFPSVDGQARVEVGPVPHGLETGPGVVGLAHLDPPTAQAELRRLAQRVASAPFDLERGPLVRFVLVRLGDREHVLLVALHHIVADGGSLPLLFHEALVAYDGGELPDLPLQYADFAAWQRRVQDARALAAGLAWWRGRLEGLPPALELTGDRPRPARRTGRGYVVKQRLPASLVESVDALARRRDATRFMALLAAFEGLLGRLGGGEDFAVGTPIAQRGHRQLEPLIGLFLNTLVLRADLSGAPSFEELVDRARQTSLEAFAHQDVPFERLVEELAPRRSRSHEPLVQVLLVLEGAERVPERGFGGLHMEPFPVATGAAKLDLTLSLAPAAGGGLELFLESSSDLFDPTSTRRLAERFERLLAAAVETPTARLAELPWLSPSESFQIQHAWNDTVHQWPGGVLGLDDLLAAQATQTPTATAVVEGWDTIEAGDGEAVGGRSLTFGELRRRALDLGRRLAALGAGPEVVVGLCAERSLEMVVGLCGTLASGAAWLPLDPSYPPGRLAFMLADADAPVLLVAAQHRGLFAEYPGTVLVLEEVAGASTQDAAVVPASGTEHHPGAMAYLIYTSGSTGRPKGVENSHRGIVNRLLWLQEKEPLEASDRVLQKTPISFDVSVWELLWPLVTGARLVLARPGGQRDSSYLARVIAQQGITTLHFVPSMLRPFLEEPDLERRGRGLRRVLTSGEALAPEVVERFDQRLPVPLWNLYGPTEAAVEVSWWRAPRRHRGLVPIGRPIANLRLTVVDGALRPVPVGMPGELLIGGVGVARGYCRRPALTAAVFVPDPFSGEPGARMYRTGDLARYLPGGEIDFLGRLDHQVKVRGQRVELGEIDAALEERGEIRAAATVALEEGGTATLVAFLVPAVEEVPDPADLRRVLAERLPAAMVPSRFLEIDELPLTPSGKLHRAELQERAQRLRPLAGADTVYVAPRTPVEEMVAGIWEELLGVDRVGVHDDFFALGGHSLLATRVVARLRTALGVEPGSPQPDLQMLFEAPTVADLVSRLPDRSGSVIDPDTSGPRPGQREEREEVLSFAQERLWFLDRLEPGTAHYNLPVAVRWRGELRIPALASALAALQERHEALRTTFREREGRPVPEVAEPGPFQVPVVDLSDRPDGRAVAREIARREAVRPFDLERGPLWRAMVLRWGPADGLLLLVLHHIIADGWSLGVLVEELASFYRGGETPPALPVQYGDFARWQRETFTDELLADSLDWWRQTLDGATTPELPTDRPRRPLAEVRGATCPIDLGPDLTVTVRALARRTGGTVFMTLLAALDVLLARLAGTADVVVGTAVANRRHPAVEGLIGFFVNTLMLRTDLAGNPTVEELLARVRTAALAAFDHQDLPFEKLVEALQPERTLGATPLVRVMLVLQNTPRAALELPGLRLEPMAVESPSAKMDLTFTLTEEGGSLAGTLRYREDLFDSTTARRLVRMLGRILERMAESPERRLDEVSLWGPGERQQVLAEWSQPAAPAMAWPTLAAPTLAAPTLAAPTLAAPTLAGPMALERVERLAAREPEAPSLADEETSWTRGETISFVGRLSDLLRAAGAGPESIVALCCERSVHLVAAMLGCWRTGAAFVVLDPAAPAERLAFQLADSGARIVLTTSELAEGHAALWEKRRVVVLDDPDLLSVLAAPAVAPASPSPLDPRSLAYVIYTSGSTGRPKGVGVEHRQLAAYLDGLEQRLDPPPRSWAMVSSPVADLGHTAIFGALTRGARLVVPGRERVADPDAFGDFMARHEIEALKIVPSHLAALLGGERPRASLPRRWLVLGGEATGEDLACEIRKLRPECRVMNHYGPTETTVGVVAGALPEGALLGSPPLGRPLVGSRAFVVDRVGRPLPVGIPGELRVGGPQVSRGYLGRPGLTAASFLPDALPGALPGSRLYTTGDQVRWRGDGTLEFLGRLDQQLKIRGFRVECGEVEAVLRQCPEVRSAAVVASMGAENEEDARAEVRLGAFVVLEPATPISEVGRWLHQRLPEVMVPSVWEELEALPRLPNGKVDRPALVRRADVLTASVRGRPGPLGEALTTATEQALAGLWQELLGGSVVDPAADFFALGGHSLLATRLLSAVRRTFEVDLPLRAIFEAPVLAALAARIDRARQETPTLGLSVFAVERRPEGEDAPLSFAQERLWVLDQLAPGSPAYNLPYAVALEGALDLEALATALGEVTRRHGILRTSFPRVGEEPVQRVAPWQPTSLPRVDLRALPSHVREPEAQRWLRHEARRGFDLAQGPLLRALVIELGGTDFRLLLGLHHIVSDAWSRGLLVHELGALYGRQELPELALSYADFARWQRRSLATFDAPLGAAVGDLQGAPTLNLPTDRPRLGVRAERRGHQIPFELPAATAAGLRDLARQEGATVFMALLAVFDLLLARHSGQQDLMVGTSVAHRNRPEIEGLLGFFVNPLVLRARLDEVVTWRQLLLQARETTLTAYGRQDLPYERLVAALGPGAAPIQAMLVLQNAPSGSLELPGLKTRPLHLDTATAKFDLTLVLEERGDTLAGSLEIDHDLFDPTTGERFLAHFAALARAAVAGADDPLEELLMLSVAERHQVIVEWNTTGQPLPRVGTIYGCFVRRAAQDPKRTALVGGGERMTYGELAERAAALAVRLRRLGVGLETRVGLCADRSLDTVVAILGILGAEGAYVPLDPSYPRERLAFMVGDAAMPWVLVEPAFRERFEGFGAELPEPPGILDLAGRGAAARDRPELPRGPEVAARLEMEEADPLAYVMYTSGSTGRPKGVAVGQRAVLRLVLGSRFMSFGPDEVFLQYAPISFDASTLELWAPLLHGGRLALAPPGRISLAELSRVVRDQRVTSLWLTSGLFNGLVEEGMEGFEGVRQLLAGGDVLSPPHVRRALAALPGLTLVNGYGPTENTTFTCCHTVDRDSTSPGEIPVGRPIGHTQTYILDRRLQPVPRGAVGELVTGGEGLARGYLGRPARTAEVFVPDPFAGSGVRLYRTGDLARQRADGVHEFLGRSDRQVKVRGFRIEPGEIEARLVDLPEIRFAAVVPRDDLPGGRALAAFVVAADGHGGPELENDLRTALLAEMPEHLVPAVFQWLDTLPLNANGKVDRGALAKLELERSAETPDDGLRGTHEELLAVLWAEALELDSVGPLDDFFTLGGNSLLATRLVSRVRQAFGVELSLERLFEAPSVRALGEVLRAAEGTAARPLPAIEAARSTDPAPLSFAQERLWFLDHLQPGDPAYHIAVAIELSGPLDLRALAASLVSLVNRHGALRTSFFRESELPVQRLVESPDVALPLLDLGALPPVHREREQQRWLHEGARRAFDLGAAPLLRLRLIRRGRGEHTLLLVLHHIVADGWSIGVLIRELAAFYAAFGGGERLELPPLPLGVPDFALWQRQTLSELVLEEHLRFWREHLAGAPRLELPFDRPRPPVPGRRGASLDLALGPELSAALNRLARHQGTTLFMTLLAAFQVLLARFAGQDDVVVGTPVANRDRPEIEGLVGFFVNTLALRARPGREDPFDQVLGAVRRTVLAAWRHRDLPFEKLVEALPVARDLSTTPVFQAMFILQNLPWSDLELEGLELRTEPVDTGNTKFELTLALAEGKSGLAGALEYRPELFDATTVERLAGSLRQMLEGVVAEPTTPWRDLPLLDRVQRAQIQHEWNDADLPPRDAAQTLPSLFLAQAARTPDAEALVTTEERWTYRDLDQRMRSLAARLRTEGVGREVPVAVFLDRRAELVTSVLAVLAAGGTYVPVDPAYPAERVAYLLADSGAERILTRGELVSRLLSAGAEPRRILDHDELGADLMDEPPMPWPLPMPEQLAYLIYTSGSTGQPKGVALEHRSAVELLGWARATYGPEELSGVLAATSICFDLSIFELFAPLAWGGRVILAADVLALADHPAREEVTLVNTVPSALAELTRAEALPASVRTVNLAGEALRRTVVDTAYAQPGVRQVWNLYGPSEDTTYSTGQRIARRAEAAPTIGRPLPGTRVRVVDDRLRSVPLGVVGELVLAGRGLARGYLGRPARTAESFVPDPWSPARGGRLYRTGDLVRLRSDGELLFLGRRDHQVKVRGFRIELGEVERALAAHPSLREVVASVQEEHGQPARLVAHVVPAEKEAPTSGELRTFLRERLPEAMVPSFFVVLEVLPRTTSGKVDRRALPSWRSQRGEMARRAPRDDLEEVLAGLWAEALGLDEVGVEEDFFELGGHSLLATRLAYRLRETLRLDVPLRTLFEAPTVAGLAESLRRDPSRGAQVDRVAAVLLRIARLSEAEAAEKVVSAEGDRAR